MIRPLCISVLLGVVLLALPAMAQQSDFAVKKDFESRYDRLSRFLEGSTNTSELDTLKSAVDGLEIDFAPHTALLDKALYPATFEQRMKALRLLYARTYDMLHVMETQGAQITVMESTIQELTVTLDTLTRERDRLFDELHQNRASMAAMRETIHRLQEHLKVNDQLLFALVDSLFMPYGSDLARMGDTQRSTLSARLEKANVLNRVQDIASDNLRFLKATEFQAGDFTTLIDNYQQFSSHWLGLSDKILAVAHTESAGTEATGVTGGTGGKTTAPRTTGTGHVDSLMFEWHASIQKAFWTTLGKEFTSRGVQIQPFTDAPGFSASIRACVQDHKANNTDARVFVEDVWKARIDREWKAALTRESMLGNEEYAALNALVTSLTPPTMDTRYLLYIGIIAVVAAVLWWLLARKRRPPEPKPTTP
jgi:hypothetical protein